MIFISNKTLRFIVNFANYQFDSISNNTESNNDKSGNNNKKTTRRLAGIIEVVFILKLKGKYTLSIVRENRKNLGTIHKYLKPG